MVRPEDRAFVRWREAGDAEALARVYDDTAPVLLRIALHHVRHPAAAEDLVQATFLAAIENAAGYDAARPLLGWLVGILHNQAKWLQRREGRAVDASRLSERAAADPLAAAQAKELTAQCDAAIDSLPEVYRPVLRLSLRHELSAAEIAHALGRAPGTVRSQIARGLELLRTALPAGTALAAFAVLTPARGLAAVREVVLAAGAQHVVATAGTAASTLAAAGAAKAGAITATTTVLAAGVTMKKTALAFAAAAMLLGGAWLALGPPAAADHGSSPAPEPAAQASTASAGRTTSSRDDAPQAAARTAVAATEVEWRLSGTVAGAAGPAAGAGVEVAVLYGGDPEPFAATTTGADGRYEIDLGALRSQPRLDLERAQLALGFRAHGQFAIGDARLPHHDAARALTVTADATLQAAAIVAGRVVDPGGRAVAAAEVTARAAHSPDGSSAKPVASARTRTDGRYVLCVPHTERIVVTAEHVGSGRAELACDAALARDHTLPDLVLRSTTALRARVEFADGEPAAGVDVLVHAESDGDSSIATATTGVDGMVAFRTLAAGRYRVSPSCHTKGNVPSAIAGTDGSAVTLVLTGLHQLRFRFEDEHGRAVRPMGVAYEKWEAGLADAAAAFAAGGDLTPELEAGHGSGFGGIRSVLLRSGTWLHVEASHGEARAEAIVQAAPPRNVHDVTLTLRELRRTATLRVELACSDGSPPGDVELRLHQLRLGEPGSYELAVERDGAALVTRWSPGRYRLEVRPKQRANDFGAFARFERVVELRDGEATVVAETVQPGGRVRLHLRPPDAQTRAHVEGFAVETPAAAGDRARRRFVQELADGWIMLGHTPANTPLLWMPLLPPGRHVLAFRSREFEDTSLAVDVAPRAVTDVHVWLRPR